MFFNIKQDVSVFLDQKVKSDRLASNTFWEAIKTPLEFRSIKYFHFSRDNLNSLTEVNGPVSFPFLTSRIASCKSEYSSAFFLFSL